MSVCSSRPVSLNLVTESDVKDRRCNGRFPGLMLRRLTRVNECFGLWLLKNSFSRKAASNPVIENVYPDREDRLQGFLHDEFSVSSPRLSFFNKHICWQQLTFHGKENKCKPKLTWTAASHTLKAIARGGSPASGLDGGGWGMKCKNPLRPKTKKMSPTKWRATVDAAFVASLLLGEANRLEP